MKASLACVLGVYFSELHSFENALVQRFPTYRDADTNANPSGDTRQIQYKLVPGEAGWVLKFDRMVEYGAVET